MISNDGIDPRENKMQYIRKKLSTEELLLQLAEEAAELSKAALKSVRVGSTNVTTITSEEAKKQLLEEIADVILCLDVIGFENDLVTIMNIADYKLNRWEGRLKHGKASESI